MAKPKKIKAQVDDMEAFVGFVKGVKTRILPLEFADLNTVKDKLNEVIALING